MNTTDRARNIVGQELMNWGGRPPISAERRNMLVSGVRFRLRRGETEHAVRSWMREELAYYKEHWGAA